MDMHLLSTIMLSTGIQLGQYPGLVITDLAIAKEAFIDQADIFSDKVTHTDFSQMIEKNDEKGSSSVLIDEHSKEFGKILIAAYVL